MPAKSSDSALPVSHHKFQAPAKSKQQVIRGELLERILSDSHYRCYLIQAPAGHGKSTFMQQVMVSSREQGIQTAWLKLDEADNDLARLVTHLNCMLSSIEDALEILSQPGNKASSFTDSIANQFNNRLAQLEPQIHLFFDDFQLIDESDVEGLFRNIIINLPSNVTMFIGSRSLPRIDISSLQVNQLLELIRHDELKFSIDEARQFFQIEDRLSLSEDELITIYSRTEGWPAALQLFRLTLARISVKQSLNNLESYTPFQITEYLSSNVLAAQPKHIQSFLLSCALLPKLSASLCERITGDKNSQDTLQYLEEQGLFLNNIDSEHHWYQFHGLFAQYLTTLTRKRSVARYREIHFQAAQWFFEQGLYEESLMHALEAQDYDLAMEAMDIWATEQITNACLHSVERWAARLPLAHVSKHPRLAVKITWALTFLRRRAKVLPYLELLRTLKENELDEQFRTERQITMAVVEMSLDHLQSCFANIDAIVTENHEAQGFWAFELGAAANIQAYRDIARGNFAAARYHIALGRNHNSDGRAPFLAGYNAGLTISSCYLQGRVDEAAQRSMSALQLKGLDIEESYAAVAAVCCSLYPLYERRELDTAIKVFNQYRNEIDTGLLLDFVVAAYLPMIRLFDSQNDAEAAESLLESLEDIGISANWPRVVKLCQWESVRRRLLSGDIQYALAASKEIEDVNEEESYLTFAEAIEDPYLSKLRLLVYSQPDGTTASLLHDAIIRARDNNRIPRELKLRLLSAMLKAKQDKPELARKELKVALTMAADYGFKSSIIDEGPELIALIRSQSDDHWPINIKRYINQIVTQENGNQTVAEATPPSESLTTREMQMLSLLCKGQTNKDIARQLFVSENTVKFHLKNIFSKLGVKTRTQAISNAVQLGLM